MSRSNQAKNFMKNAGYEGLIDGCQLHRQKKKKKKKEKYSNTEIFKGNDLRHA